MTFKQVAVTFKCVAAGLVVLVVVESAASARHPHFFLPESHYEPATGEPAPSLAYFDAHATTTVATAGGLLILPPRER